MPPVPSVSITKQTGNTGVVRPSPVGVLAIIAESGTGTVNLAGSYARQDLALNDFGYGPLVEFAAYDLAVANNPVLLVKGSTSTAATYYGLTNAITGSSTPTNPAPSTASNTPLEDYEVVINFTFGGTVGVAGILYTYSLDGGRQTSAVQQLGTAASIVIPNSGVTLNLGAGAINTGDSVSFFCTHARMNSSDLSNALTALGNSGVPWEGVLIDSDIGTGTVAVVDTFLAGLEGQGKFKFFALNTRAKNQPVPTAESEAVFLAAMTTLASAQASIRGVVGSDYADCISALGTGWTLPRPVSLAVAARAMSIQIGVDPAYVALGPIPNFSIADSKGNPRWHDEALFPGLDAQRLSTLRSLNGSVGVFITNANAFSAPGSDYVYLQHIRTMNRACEVSFQILTTQLSVGVGKKPKDQITGLIYIREQDAQRIEALVNAALAVALKNQVANFAFVLSRTDDLSSNAGATVHGEIQLQALAYIKNFQVAAKYVKAIAVNV